MYVLLTFNVFVKKKHLMLKRSAELFENDILKTSLNN